MALALPVHLPFQTSRSIVRIQEDNSYSGSTYHYEDCLRPGPVYNLAECASFRRRYSAMLAARAKEEDAAKAKAAADAAKIARSKTPAAKTLASQDRNAAAVKPLAPLATPAPPKPVPGKTPPEKLRYMLGQLLLTGFAGREPEDRDVARAARDISEGKISGIIIRDSNIENFQQLRQLLAALANYGADMPALVAIDQPGGADTALSEEKGFNFFAAANTVSSGNTPQDAQLLYRAMASDLAALGVSLNIGPSEDTCGEDGVSLSAPCFGAAPAQIAAYARAFNFGHHDRGVLTALRHTPLRAGLSTASMKQAPNLALLNMIVHGDASDALVVRVKALEPIPFGDVSLRLLNRKVRMRDGGAPGLHGALIFEIDDGPGGAPIRYEDIFVRALQAGADMILIREPSNMPKDFLTSSVNAVQMALKSGRLSMARVEDAYNNIERLKARLRVVRPRTKIAGLAR